MGEIPTIVGGFERNVSAGMNLLVVGAPASAADRVIAEIERGFPAPETMRFDDEAPEDRLRDPNTVVVTVRSNVPAVLEHYTIVLYFSANNPPSFNTDVFRLRQAQFEPSVGQKILDSIKFLLHPSYTLVLERGAPIKTLAL